MVRYAGEHAEDTGASTLDRSIGSASYRQASVNRYQSVVGSWTRILSPTMVNALSTSFSTYHNRIDPVTAEPQLTFPSLADGASFRVPQGTTQKRFQLSDSATLVRGAHTIKAAASGSASSATSTWMCSARAASSWSKTSPISITTAMAEWMTRICCLP